MREKGGVVKGGVEQKEKEQDCWRRSLLLLSFQSRVFSHKESSCRASAWPLFAFA